MNSGLQDALKLAWKLSLVCQGHCTPGILDSYEAERRPVAEMIAASGDAIEHAQTLTDPAERRTRDEAFRAVFADPTSRHHEAIAEAELDIDYGDSPVVMGDEHDALSPGGRLPDTINFGLAGAECSWLHELTHRTGHTALLIGGSSTHGDVLARLDSSIRASCATSLIEATFVLTTRSDNPNPCLRLEPAARDQLGISDVTLLVIRADGHVGLRADRDHLEALAAYHTLLASGRI